MNLTMLLNLASAIINLIRASRTIYRYGKGIISDLRTKDDLFREVQKARDRGVKVYGTPFSIP